MFQVSDGEVVGGLGIEFKTGNIYTLRNFGGIGYFWFEGTYEVRGDTIILKGETDVINNKLLIKRDSLACPEKVAVTYKDTDSNGEELQVVFDSLFCKQKAR